MIKYKRRTLYKYTLFKDYRHQTDLGASGPIDVPYISLDGNGLLTIKTGYAWDGPSGPTIDTKNFMRGSLVHDALYQLMRTRHLDHGHRKYADQLLKRICLESGMSRLRAWWVYQGVRLGGRPSIVDVFEAP